MSPEQKSASRLVISESSQGNKTISFMSVTTDNDFLTNNQGSLSNFTYKEVPTQFKGVEMHYDIKGNFHNGWHFNQGKIDGIVQRSRNNEIHPRTCQSGNICYEIERFTVQVGNYARTTIVIDCSYSMIVGFCNGWFDFDYYSGGTNSWGGSSNSEWGDAYPDEGSQLSKLNEQITDNLQHDCLKGILYSLQGDVLLQTLKVFHNNNNIPNISLHFQEGTLPPNIFAKTTGNGRSQTITLDYNKLSSSTDLFISEVIIHESIHAYFQMYLTVIHPEWFSQAIMNSNVSLESAQFYDLFKAYIQGSTPNVADHSQMAATYRIYIRDALMRVLSSGSDSDLQICSDLAWSGLDYSALTQEQRTRIINRISAEAQSQPIGNQSPRGGLNACQ